MQSSPDHACHVSLTFCQSFLLSSSTAFRKHGHVLMRALDLEVEDQREKGRPKRTWKEQVEEESVKIGLRREDALCQSKWSVGVNQIAAGFR